MLGPCVQEHVFSSFNCNWFIKKLYCFLIFVLFLKIFSVHLFFYCFDNRLLLSTCELNTCAFYLFFIYLGNKKWNYRLSLSADFRRLGAQKCILAAESSCRQTADSSTNPKQQFGNLLQAGPCQKRRGCKHCWINVGHLHSLSAPLAPAAAALNVCHNTSAQWIGSRDKCTSPAFMCWVCLRTQEKSSVCFGSLSQL